MMMEYQQRVMDEKNQLAERLGKLNDFMLGTVFLSLTNDEKNRLNRQGKIMQLYLDVLEERVEAF